METEKQASTLYGKSRGLRVKGKGFYVTDFNFSVTNFFFFFFFGHIHMQTLPGHGSMDQTHPMAATKATAGTMPDL